MQELYKTIRGMLNESELHRDTETMVQKNMEHITGIMMGELEDGDINPDHLAPDEFDTLLEHALHEHIRRSTLKEDRMDDIAQKGAEFGAKVGTAARNAWNKIKNDWKGRSSNFVTPEIGAKLPKPAAPAPAAKSSTPAFSPPPAKRLVSAVSPATKNQISSGLSHGWKARKDVAGTFANSTSTQHSAVTSNMNTLGVRLSHRTVTKPNGERVVHMYAVDSKKFKKLADFDHRKHGESDGAHHIGESRLNTKTGKWDHEIYAHSEMANKIAATK